MKRAIQSYKNKFTLNLANWANFTKERKEGTMGIGAKPFFIWYKQLHWHEKIILTSTAMWTYEAEAVPVAASVLTWPPHSPAPFPFGLSLPFNHRLSYLVGILLYHCLPRGHGGWATWDLAFQVYFNNIGVPGAYSDWPWR